MADAPTAKKLVIHEVNGPDLRPTGQMPAALRTERLLESLVESVSKLDAKVTNFDKGLTTVAQDVAVIKSQLSAENEARRKHSGSIAAVNAKADGASSHNLEQDAAIAHVITDVAEVKTAITALAKETGLQTTLLKDLKTIKDNKTVQRIAYLVGAIILAWLLGYAKAHGIPVPL